MTSRYIQIVVVLVLILMAIYNEQHYTKYNGIIEDNKELNDYIKDLEDHVNLLNDSISVTDCEIEAIELKNDSLKKKVKGLDRTILKIKNKYNDEIRNVDNLDADSTIVVLSNFLSK